MNVRPPVPRHRSPVHAIAIGLSILVVAAVVVCFFAVPGCLRTLGPKAGRIIDHDTGDGVSDATVVVSGWYRQTGTFRNIYFCTYAEMTRTDENGYYHLPREYSRWTLSSPWAEPENLWMMYASKDGFILADTKWPFEYDGNGGINPSVKTWVSTSYATPLKGLEIQIPPIELMQVNMSLKERIAYFSHTGLAKFCNATDTSFSAMKRAVHQFYESVTQTVCNSPADEALESSALNLLPLYADDTQKFYAAWQALDPRSQQHQSLLHSTIYRMADVCKVAQAGASATER